MDYWELLGERMQEIAMEEGKNNILEHIFRDYEPKDMQDALDNARAKVPDFDLMILYFIEAMLKEGSMQIRVERPKLGIPLNTEEYDDNQWYMLDDEIAYVEEKIIFLKFCEISIKECLYGTGI